MPADKTVRLWTRAPAEARIAVSPSRFLSVDDSVQGGQTFVVTVTDTDQLISVEANHPQWTTRWQLRLGNSQTPSWYDEASEALASGDIELARSLLAAQTDDAGGLKHDLLANIAFRDGDTEAFRRHHRRAADANRDAGRLSMAVRNLTALSWSLMQDRAFVEADVALKELPTDWDGPAESRYNTDYAHGLLAFNIGNPREALRRLQSAAARAERLGTARQRMDADALLAIQLQRLGRPDDAATRLTDWLSNAKDLSPCQEASLRTNLGWTRLLSIEAGDTAPTPIPQFARARAIFDANDCGFSEGRAANNLVNLALAHLHDGALEEAASLLAITAQQTELPARTTVWHKDVTARLAIEQGAPDQALRIYASLTTADTASIAGGRWRVAVGRARALEALNDGDGALDQYALAEQLLDDVINDVPITAGRASFLAQRRRATRRHLSLLLDLDRVADAFLLARRSRARVLRSVNCFDRLDQLDPIARNTWLVALTEYEKKRVRAQELVVQSLAVPADEAIRLDDEIERTRAAARENLDEAFAVCGQPRNLTGELPQVAPGELLLAYHPLTSGWIGFALFDNVLHSRPLDCVDTATTRPAQSACLLGPFSELVERARRVRIQSLGHLNRVDFHALGDADSVVLASRPVVYGLDLAGESKAPTGVIRRALVVADTRGNLAAAREEARAVERLLRSRGVDQIEVLQGDEADMSAVKNALRNADLFHYAGHAIYSGHGGWDSVLQLAQGSELSVADILALDRVPHTIVLSGCDTGRAAQDDAPESLGLAQAFLASGAHVVVAASRPVDDAVALDMVAGIYRNWSDQLPLENALRLAQIRMRHADEDADWAAYRLFMR